VTTLLFAFVSLPLAKAGPGFPWEELDSLAIMSLWHYFSLGPSCRDQNEAVIAWLPEWSPEKNTNNLPSKRQHLGLNCVLLIRKIINFPAASLVRCFSIFF
jgi:hypothetical protein